MTTAPAVPDVLEELWAKIEKDPLLVPDADFDKLIEFYRAQRQTFLQQEAEARLKPKRTRAVKGQTQAALPAPTSLDDLLS